MRCRKRLIICFDGTWNNADNGGNPTNVVRIARAIPSVGADGIPQIVYYEPGVGTGIFDKYIGGVFGRGLEQNVKNGYLFLAHNYCGGDEGYAADEIYVLARRLHGKKPVRVHRRLQGPAQAALASQARARVEVLSHETGEAE